MLSTASWWNVTPDLFVGLVTHARSRFPDAVTESGLQQRLVSALTSSGMTVMSGISDRDEYTPELLPLTRQEVLASVSGELDSELRWREYLAGKPAGMKLHAFMLVRRAKRTIDFAPPWRRTLAADDTGPRMARRLANIELSHLRIIEEAVASGAGWALLIEDDAGADDVDRFAAQLREFLDAADHRGQPVMMNLSESFTPEVLGIEPLLTPIAASDAGTTWRVFSAERPVTNTVCAVLYRGDFLTRMLDVLRTIPISPVIPIDFKLNEAVIRLAPTMAPGDCWVASPAPLEQRSGVPTIVIRP